jgi:hypothetical protein
LYFTVDVLALEFVDVKVPGGTGVVSSVASKKLTLPVPLLLKVHVPAWLEASAKTGGAEGWNEVLNVAGGTMVIQCCVEVPANVPETCADAELTSEAVKAISVLAPTNQRGNFMALSPLANMDGF